MACPPSQTLGCLSLLLWEIILLGTKRQVCLVTINVVESLAKSEQINGSKHILTGFTFDLMFTCVEVEDGGFERWSFSVLLHSLHCQHCWQGFIQGAVVSPALFPEFSWATAVSKEAAAAAAAGPDAGCRWPVPMPHPVNVLCRYILHLATSPGHRPFICNSSPKPHLSTHINTCIEMLLLVQHLTRCCTGTAEYTYTVATLGNTASKCRC